MTPAALRMKSVACAAGRRPHQPVRNAQHTRGGVQAVIEAGKAYLAGLFAVQQTQRGQLQAVVGAQRKRIGTVAGLLDQRLGDVDAQEVRIGNSKALFCSQRLPGKALDHPLNRSLGLFAAC